MSTDFEIRLARPDDFEEMGNVFQRSVRETAARDYTPKQIAAWSSYSDDKELWASDMASRVNYLAVQDGKIVGFAQYEPPDHIDMTYVHPDFTRKGVGRALLGALKKDATHRGVQELHTEASITARPFFEACGYELIVPQIVRVRGMDFLNYRMWKRIGSPA